MIHILLAAYNEEKALGDVLRDVARALADGDLTVWVVDDGSTDGTARVAQTWGRSIPLRLLRHDQNQGLGAALHTGFTSVIAALGPGDSVVTLDADNTHPPAQIPSLVQPIEDGRADVVVASRFVPGAREVGVPWFRRLLSRGASFLFRAALPVPGLRDYTCGFRAVRGDLLKAVQDRWGRLVTEKGFAASAEWMIKLSALHPRVVEVPLILRYDRKPGASKMRVFETIRRNLAVIGRLRAVRRSTRIGDPSPEPRPGAPKESL